MSQATSVHRLKLVQKSPIYYYDFVRVFIPMVEIALGGTYKLEPLSRSEGGFSCTRRNGVVLPENALQVRVEWMHCWNKCHLDNQTNKILDLSDDTDSILLTPPRAKGIGPKFEAGIHTIEYRSEGLDESNKGWARPEMEIIERMFVERLRWRPLKSLGFKKANEYFQSTHGGADDNCDSNTTVRRITYASFPPFPHPYTNREHPTTHSMGTQTTLTSFVSCCTTCPARIIIPNQAIFDTI